MGEVYRGRDARLNRDVALKVLPAHLAADSERMARFQREAQLLASLNHPHIAALYGLEEAVGIRALVMELVDGPTLGERLAAGPLPIEEVLSLAAQIAEALEAAHAKGIIHRDLKPANIKITRQGIVKVLDFGLAKSDAMAANSENSPTLTLAGSAKGVILGTAAYMSLEQAEGKNVDSRSDIFSFGAVLYEMTTGRRAFEGESLLSILAAVLRENPKPVRELTPAAPASLVHIIDHCLAKLPEKRWQSMTDIKLLLRDLEQGHGSEANIGAEDRTKPARRPWIPIMVGVAALFAGALLSRVFLTSAKPGGRVTPPAYTMLTSDSGLSFEPAISRDGKLVAYASDRAGEGNLDIWLRQLPNGSPVRLTNDPADDQEPDFSPDGSKIVFSSDRAGGGLYTISPLGGGLRKIADYGHRPRFSPDGKWIAYWMGERHLAVLGTVWIIPATGGEPKKLTPNFTGAEDPVWAPDSKGIIALGRSGYTGRPEWLYLPIDGSKPGVCVSSAQLQALGLTAPPLQANLRPAAFAEGSIIFAAGRAGTSALWRLPVSESTCRPIAAPVPLTAGPVVHSYPSATAGGSHPRYVFSVLSLRSSIVSIPASAATPQTASDRKRWTDGQDVNTHPSVSSDGKKLAYISNRSGNPEVWFKDIGTGKESMLTETPWGESYPRISRDGSQVMFIGRNAGGNRNLGLIDSAGGAPRSYCEGKGELSGDWMEDGRSFVYLSENGLSLLRVPSGESIPLVNRFVLEPRGSPDGRWIVFHAGDGPTTRQVFVVPFRNRLVPREEWIPITSEEGMNRNAAWAPDGRRVYFLSDRDRFRCIWAQNLDAASKRPIGEPYAVYHSHSARFSLANFVGQGLISVSAAQDRLFFAEPEVTGNIWMLEPAQH
jgi:Tol biopolymer transport system component